MNGCKLIQDILREHGHPMDGVALGEVDEAIRQVEREINRSKRAIEKLELALYQLEGWKETEG